MDPHTQQPMQQPVQPQGHMPPQGQFNQSPHMQPPHTPQENPGHTLSIVGLILGIVGILATCASIITFGITLMIGVPLSIAGLICSIIGRSRTPQGMPSGMAIAGIILGAVGILAAMVIPALGILGLAILEAESGTTGSELQYLLDALENY